MGMANGGSIRGSPKEFPSLSGHVWAISDLLPNMWIIPPRNHTERNVGGGGLVRCRLGEVASKLTLNSLQFACLSEKSSYLEQQKKRSTSIIYVLSSNISAGFEDLGKLFSLRQIHSISPTDAPFVFRFLSRYDL